MYLCVPFRWQPFRDQLRPNPQRSDLTLPFGFPAAGWLVGIQAGRHFASSMDVEGLDLSFEGWLGPFTVEQLGALFPKEATTFQVGLSSA